MSFHDDYENFKKSSMCIGHDIDFCGCATLSDDHFEYTAHHELKDGIRQIYWFILIRQNPDNDGASFVNFDIRRVADCMGFKVPDAAVRGKHRLASLSRFLIKCQKVNPDIDILTLLVRSMTKDQISNEDDVENRLREAHPNSQQYALGSNLLLDAADKIKQLRIALLDCNKIHNECIGGGGIPDCIDNDGGLYQSQHLASLIDEATKSL
ncbi:hypothetical protein R50073_24280 [Maricurvus nonylphenolicus]|uniref:hypothetical protein n=1 Tax=Maricurvus nonylphenolicus TaxID=1008307 RepID=UPI0036F1A752